MVADAGRILKIAPTIQEKVGSKSLSNLKTLGQEIKRLIRKIESLGSDHERDLGSQINSIRRSVGGFSAEDDLAKLAADLLGAYLLTTARDVLMLQAQNMASSTGSQTERDFSENLTGVLEQAVRIVKDDRRSGIRVEIGTPPEDEIAASVYEAIDAVMKCARQPQ